MFLEQKHIIKNLTMKIFYELSAVLKEKISKEI